MERTESQVRQGIPSDLLPTLRIFVRTWATFAEMLPVAPSIHVVIDANVAISDVLWLARRSDHAAGDNLRTALEELADAGSVVLAAPPTVADEVERHLDRIAVEQGVEVRTARALWTRYRTRIKIVEALPGTVPPGVPDPDDLPYVWLQDQLGAAGVATRNERHVVAAGGRPIHFEAFLAFRDYSRAVTVELTFAFAGVTVSALGIEAIRALYELLKRAVKQIRTLPAGTQYLLAAALAVVVASPWLREKIGYWIGVSAEAIGPLWAKLAPLLEAYALQYAEAQKRRPQLEKALPAVLQSPDQVTARAYLLRALASAEEPLPLEELLVVMREDGYAPRAADPRPYLRRLLRSDPRARQAVDGRWKLRSRGT